MLASSQGILRVLIPADDFGGLRTPPTSDASAHLFGHCHRLAEKINPRDPQAGHLSPPKAQDGP
jgi:hypothetical protein